MLQHVENIGNQKIRFTTKHPSLVEVVIVDGDLFVKSETIKPKKPTEQTP